jgi:hypothetical protein
MISLDQQTTTAALFGSDALARWEAGMRREEWLKRLCYVRRVVMEFAFIIAILMCLVGLACFLIALAVRL